MTAQTSPLLAALDAIEETARRATPGPWNCSTSDAWPPDSVWAGDDPRDGIVHASWEAGDTTALTLAHIALHDPAFTLRLVEGLREVVALHTPYAGANYCPVCIWAEPDDAEPRSPCPTLAALTRALAGEEER
jgi:hypothetical protein